MIIISYDPEWSSALDIQRLACRAISAPAELLAENCRHVQSVHCVLRPRLRVDTCNTLNCYGTVAILHAACKGPSLRRLLAR